MSPPARHEKVRGWQFGPYRLDLTQGHLLKHGTRIRLQDQPLRVLELLLERRQELVTREEIRQLLWGNDTFVDFDHALNATITRLRQALNDSAASPRYIETLARKGYRFIGSAEAIPDSCQDLLSPVPEEVAVPAMPPPVREDRAFGLWRKIAVTAALVGATAYLVSGVDRSGGVELKWSPLTAYPGFETRPALSPDGKTVAFSWLHHGSYLTDIYIKPVDGDSPSPVTATPDVAEYDAAWSPDGRRLGFLRRRHNHIQIVVIDLSSRIERTIADVRVCGFRSLAWSANGEYLLTTQYEGNSCVLSALSVASGASSRVIRKSGSLTYQHAPALSPDGRELAFIGCTTDSLCRVYRVEVGAGGNALADPEPLTAGPEPVQAVAWIPPGKHILYAVNSGATSALYMQRATPGAAARKLAPLRQDCVHISAARQRSIVALSNFCGVNDVWELPLGKQSPGKALVASTVHETGGTYSPDGQRIAFTSARSGAMEIWTAAHDGKSATAVTSLRSTTSSPEWSPDGRWIAFDSRARANADIYVVGADGSGLRQMTSEPSSEGLPTWSRDGRYIYFTSDRSGSHQIWRLDRRGGLPVQITRTGGTRALESEDGQFLYFAHQEYRDASLWRKRLPDGPEEKVCDGVSAPQSFAVGRAGIYFIRNTDPRWIVLLTSKGGGILELVRTPEFTDPGLSISPDESRALLSVIQVGESDLTLIEIEFNE
jgi:Tol biopolymer transport system component/DNA-binding winged helix-turn-helix (wHTH) protein